MQNDPEYLEDATKVSVDVSPIGADEVLRAIDRIAVAPPELLDYARRLLAEPRGWRLRRDPDLRDRQQGRSYEAKHRQNSTTHVGSLPRPADLLDIVQAREQGKPVDEKAHAVRLRTAVAEIVRKQIDLGVDIVDDGEFGKPSFVSYVNERLGGFEVDKDMPRQSPWADLREAKSFPGAYNM